METVEAVRKATYSNLDILLVDDGSIDESSKICSLLCRKDQRIRYLKKENGGIADARNFGLQNALGELICFCDQDDLTAEDMYDTLLCRLVFSGADMAICSSGKIIGKQKVPYEKMENGFYSGEEVRNKLLYPLLFRGYHYSFVERIHYFYGTVWKCMFRKKFISDNKMEFYRYVKDEDDWLFFMRSLLYAKSVVTIKNTGYYWRYHFESQSHRKKYQEDFIACIEKLEETIVALLEDNFVLPDIIKEYQKILFCRHLQVMADQKGIHLSQILNFMEEKNDNKMFTCLTYLSVGSLRSRILCRLLQRKCCRTALICNKILFFLELLGNKLFFIARLERWLKGKQIGEGEHVYKKKFGRDGIRS